MKIKEMLFEMAWVIKIVYALLMSSCFGYTILPQLTVSSTPLFDPPPQKKNKHEKHEGQGI